jgi:uncharacterized membrane protein
VAWGLFILFVLAYAIGMSVETVLRYETFKATAFDLGNMDQVLWNTIHGRLFQFTNQAADWYGPPIRLAVHVEPIILPLSLLYVFHADARILLVFQSLALATGALPIFLLTRKYIPAWPLVALMMVLAYFLSPALLGLNIFDFHPVSLATPLLLYAVLALDYKRYGWFVLACILAASCKEDIPLYIAILGIIVILKYKLPRLGGALIVGGILWSAIAFGVVIPHFYPGAQHNNFWYRYESLGSSPGEAIINIILHPWLLFTTFITLDRFYYVASILRSSGFLALLAPEWLLVSLPGLAENLLSTDSLTYSGVYQYNAAIIPFVMIAAIHGTRRFLIIWRGWRGEKRDASVAQSQVEDGWMVQALAKKEFSPGWLAGSFRASAAIVTTSVVTIRKLVMTGLYWVQHRRGYQRLSGFVKKQIYTVAELGNRQWQRFSERMIPVARGASVSRLQWVMCFWFIGMIVLNYMVETPALNGFWTDHLPGSHEQHVEQLLAKIPPDASVSAGSNLNPHLSERQHLAVFPEFKDTSDTTSYIAQYIILDLNDVFPQDSITTDNLINYLLHSGQYVEITRAEGVILLVRRSTVRASHVIIVEDSRDALRHAYVNFIRLHGGEQDAQ